jgi:hypothetical protein
VNASANATGDNEPDELTADQARASSPTAAKPRSPTSAEPDEMTADQARTYGQSPPVTAGGVGSQLGRGAEAGLYHTVGAPVDTATQQADQTGFAWQAAKDLYHLATTGEYGDKPTMPTRDQPVPGSSDWMMGKAGQVSPQLDPRNYPAQNWAERIARGAGDVGTQALLGRAAGFGGTALTKGTQALPSSVVIAKQLAAAGIGGAGGGAGAQTGRNVASHAIDVFPDFRTQHPLATEAIENVGGVIGGGVGGLTASRVAPAGQRAADLSSDQLHTIANGQYTVAKNIPANYTVPAVAQWANNHLQNLYGNYGSSQIGPIATRLNKLANPPAGAAYVPLTELTSLDDALGKVVQKNFHPVTGMTPLGSAAADTQAAIKDFTRNPTTQTVHSGDPYTAAQYFKTADGNWAAAERSKTIEEAQRTGGKAGDVAAAIDKLTPKQLRGFTPDEQQQLDRFTQGAPVRNLLSGTSRWLGHASAAGIVPALVEGYERGGIRGAVLAGAAPAAASYGLRKLSNNLSNRALNQIAAQTRQRSPAYQAIPTDQRAASPFRTTIPVGLGALSGLYGQ